MCINGRCVNEMGTYLCECDGDFMPNPAGSGCIGELLSFSFVFYLNIERMICFEQKVQVD